MSKRDHTSQPGQSEKVRKTLRGRAERACVRCRAKKRTCDGGNPCLRCKESHSACYFSDWHYAVPYPREYVEYLEEQQEQLSIALLTMRQLLKEANVQTVPALPDTDQAQDLLAPLRAVKLDNQANRAMQPVRTSFVPNPMAYDNEGDAVSSGQYRTSVSMADSTSTSPIQPSVFPPLYGTLSNQSNSKPPYLPPTYPSLLLPPRQSEPLAIPIHPRISSDPSPSGSSSGGRGSPAVGTLSTAMGMSMPGVQWSYPSRSWPASAPDLGPPGYNTSLAPSSDKLARPGENEGVANWTWMFGSEFGLPGTDCSNEQPSNVDLNWNDVNRFPEGAS